MAINDGGLAFPTGPRYRTTWRQRWGYWVAWPWVPVADRWREFVRLVSRAVRTGFEAVGLTILFPWLLKRHAGFCRKSLAHPADYATCERCATVFHYALHFPNQRRLEQETRAALGHCPDCFVSPAKEDRP